MHIIAANLLSVKSSRAAKLCYDIFGWLLLAWVIWSFIESIPWAPLANFTLWQADPWQMIQAFCYHLTFSSKPFLIMLAELCWIFMVGLGLKESTIFRLMRTTPSRQTDALMWFFKVGGGAVITAFWLFPLTNEVNRLTQSWQLHIFDSISNLLVLTLIAFLLISFVDFFIHWLSHQIPELWELHKVHHSAEEMTVLTVFREHPLLNFFNVALRLVLLSCLGLPAPVISFVLSVRVVQQLVHHSRWNTHWGFVGDVLISPRAHWLHHSTDPRHYNHNFSFDITLWDRIFGTYLSGRDQGQPENLNLGLSDSTLGRQNILWLLGKTTYGSGLVFARRFKAKTSAYFSPTT